MTNAPEKKADLIDQGLSVVSIPAPYNLEGLTKSLDWRFRVYYEGLFYKSEGAPLGFLEQKMGEGEGVYSETIDVTHDEGFNLMFRLAVRIWKSSQGDLRIEIKNIPITEGEKIDNRLTWAASTMKERADDGALAFDIGLDNLKDFMRVMDGEVGWDSECDIEDILLLGVVRMLRSRVQVLLEANVVEFLEKNCGGSFGFHEGGENVGQITGDLWQKHPLAALIRRKRFPGLPNSITPPDFLTQGIYIPREIPEEALIFNALPYGDDEENLVITTFPAREVLAAAKFEPRDYIAVDRYEVTVVGVSDPENGGQLFAWVDKKK